MTAYHLRRKEKEMKDLDEMIRHHEEIHVLAARIAELYHQGQQDRAISLMDKFNQTSRDLFSSLDKLYTT